MTPFDSAFQQVIKLSQTFKANESKFLLLEYQEAEVRKDFIDKFFIALGWDVLHEEQTNPYEQEVKVERGVYIGKQQKRADYAFFLKPNYRDVKFYVEAKKPCRNLSNADDYFQTCRYGWNAGLSITFLTDFEELHILDCRTKPDINRILNNRIKNFHYSDYSNQEKFSEIYWLLSHEAVANNSLEKFAESLPKPKGKTIQKGTHRGTYQSIDEAFLEELDEIRDSLAKSFKKSNPDLGSDELTEMTQRTIDRLVFIRFLEDKLIEPDPILDKSFAWQKFIRTCKTLDAKYNGIVFKKHLIDNENLNAPDENVFENICKELAHNNSPYNFDIIPIHILGSIYERFLGKIVIATDKRVRIEEKPEVRKAGGVYYTPQYIVNYIVENTVGKLIEGKTPKEIAKMRFADISCGSGSFLITVFDRVLEYHRKWYQDNTEQAKKDGCILHEGKWVLSLKQKQNILLNNIYGVDLDPQAIEVTQLSLYLKLLEDETTATANETWVMFKEQILPGLNNNIVCGNSLIGTDILGLTLFKGAVDELKLRPMNFEDVFPDVFKKGSSTGSEQGFDAIVGNPPYVRIQELKIISKELVDYLKKKYSAATKGNYDLYVVFVEKGITLLKAKGELGFILPNKFFNSQYGEPLRQIITSGKHLRKIIHFGANQIFQGATTYTALLFLNKTEQKGFDFSKIEDAKSWMNNFDAETGRISNDCITKDDWNFSVGENKNLINKMNKNILLDEFADIFVGLQTSADDVFILDKVTETENSLTLRSKVLRKEIKVEKNLLHHLLSGTDVKRYITPTDRQYILFPYKVSNEVAELINENELSRLYANTMEYLKHNKKRLEEREKGKFKGKEWYRFGRSQNLGIQSRKKICIPRLVENLNCTIDLKGDYYLDNVDVGGVVLKKNYTEHDLKYLCAIINSKLLGWFFPFVSATFRGGWYSANRQFISKLPIRKIDFSNDSEKAKHDHVVKLVDQILEAKKQIAAAKTASEKEYLEKKCSIIDRQIDALVYELYGLTEEEIKIVEGNG